MRDCRWLDICGGNFRVRAEAISGDVWAPDPACYLTDEEIASRQSPVGTGQQHNLGFSVRCRVSELKD